jgi:hypothetical protein
LGCQTARYQRNVKVYIFSEYTRFLSSCKEKLTICDYFNSFRSKSHGGNPVVTCSDRLASPQPADSVALPPAAVVLTVIVGSAQKHYSFCLASISPIFAKATKLDA